MCHDLDTLGCPVLHTHSLTLIKGLVRTPNTDSCSPLGTGPPSLMLCPRDSNHFTSLMADMASSDQRIYVVWT